MIKEFLSNPTVQWVMVISSLVLIVAEVAFEIRGYLLRRRSERESLADFWRD